MCRIVQMFPLIILSIFRGGAVELTVSGGGNYQRWDNWGISEYEGILVGPESVNYVGFGLNTGGLVSFGFTKPSSPATIGLETGLRYVRLNYSGGPDSVTTIVDQEIVTVPVNPIEHHYNTLTTPIALKISIPEVENFT